MRNATGRGGRRSRNDRWMVSYADMVTLLFACFAALYASTLSTTTAAAPAPALPASPDPAPLIQAIQAAMSGVAGGEDVEVSADARGVVISLPEAGTFAVGQADLSQSARRVIRELADVLERQTGDIRIEGHTDDTPISRGRFSSNWDLSAARATEVIRFLLAQTAIAPTRLSAAGYGEFRSVAPNDSPANRARNRRVDVVVVNPSGNLGSWKR